VARFEGEGLSFTQSGGPVQYTVVVDGQLESNLLTMDGEHSYRVAGALAPGEHIVEIYRRGEASFGPVVLRSVEVDAGQLLAPPPARARRIEIFGDSITCGYGNEGTTANCPFSADTENHYLSYGALLARSFEAELSIVAWSGKGVVSNYGGDTSTTLPQMVDRAVPTSDLSVWDYSLASAPQAVIINLSTNDYSTDNDPSDLEFVATYVAMLETIRARYPDAFILCTLGPMLSGTDLAVARANIDAAVNERLQAGDLRVQSFELQANNPNPGCDYHPNLSTHAAMADELSVPLKAALGW
jgi:lysophospholipase L1-like esterase